MRFPGSTLAAVDPLLKLSISSTATTASRSFANPRAAASSPPPLR